MLKDTPLILTLGPGPESVEPDVIDFMLELRVVMLVNWHVKAIEIMLPANTVSSHVNGRIGATVDDGDGSWHTLLVAWLINLGQAGDAVGDVRVKTGLELTGTFTRE